MVLDRICHGQLTGLEPLFGEPPSNTVIDAVRDHFHGVTAADLVGWPKQHFKSGEDVHRTYSYGLRMVLLRP